MNKLYRFILKFIAMRLVSSTDEIIRAQDIAEYNTIIIEAAAISKMQDYYG